MLEVSENALEKLAELLSAQPGGGAAVRVAVMGAGTNGLGIIVDDVRETDILFSKNGTPLIVDRNLIGWCKKITIDFIAGSSGTCGGSSSGFVISPEQPINL